MGGVSSLALKVVNSPSGMDSHLTLKWSFRYEVLISMPFSKFPYESLFLNCNFFISHLQAHDQAVRSMVWSYNDLWMVTGDDGGTIKYWILGQSIQEFWLYLAVWFLLSLCVLGGRYWQTNMNNVKANKSAHKESVRDLRYMNSQDLISLDICFFHFWSFSFYSLCL